MSVASLLATLGQWAPLLVLVAPLTLAGLLAFPRLVGVIGLLAPWAVLPALLAGLMAPETTLLLPHLLLGSSLMIDPIGRPFLVLLALLWLIAGWLAGERLRRRGPALLFLLAMSGSFGLAVAGNLVVFLLASTVSGYALYGLAARQPGARVFVVLLVLSDLLLFELLLLLVKGGIGLSLAPAVAPSAAIGGSLVLLLLSLLGFGAKAAIFGLHAWLPRLLSGAAVELSPLLIGFVLAAGLLPWLRLLAPGALMGANASLLSGIALVALALAVLLGLLQAGRRALLGYTLCALSGFWLLLLTVAGAGLGALMPAAEAEARALALTLALGPAGLALAALLVQAARPWAHQGWLDWSLNGFALLLLIDALLTMVGVLSFETENGLLIAASALLGGLLGQLLGARQRDTEVLLAIRPSRPLVLCLLAAGWVLLLATALDAPISAPRAAVSLILAAVLSALLAPWLARLPPVPPGDLLSALAQWLPRRFRNWV